MSDHNSVASLDQRLQTIRSQYGDSVQLGDISAVVTSLVHGRSHGDEVGKIAAELRELLQYVGSAKNELAVMQPKSLSNRDIPHATSHLNEIVKATEGAANTIMEAAEVVGEVAEHLDNDTASKLLDVTTNLYEASSFQDLTGQRITRVAKTLTHLEERLNALAEAIGDDYVAPPEDNIEVDEEGVALKDEDLLHGPQLEGEGNSQAEIDALLASFD